jgi:hypothetical protein
VRYKRIVQSVSDDLIQVVDAVGKRIRAADV